MPRKNEIDMVHGPLLAKIIIFAMPLAASSILQQLFNSVDVAVVDASTVVMLLPQSEATDR